MASRIHYNNPNNKDVLDLAYHYELLSDTKRVTALKRSIEKACPDKRVLESGAGSAILSILAVKAGANKVYAVEKDPAIFRFARENIRTMSRIHTYAACTAEANPCAICPLCRFYTRSSATPRRR